MSISHRATPIPTSGYPIHFPAILVALFALVWVLFPYFALMGGDVQIFLTKEAGPVEIMTPVLLGLAAIMLLFGPYDLPRKKWMLAAVCLLFAAREFDINKNIARHGFWFFPDDFKGNFPLGYAIIETLSVIGILCLLAYMAWTYRRVVWLNIKDRDRHQIMMLMVWVCVGISLLFDGMDAKYRDLMDVPAPLWMKPFFEGIEEGTELLLPVCILFGLLEYYRTRIWSSERPRYLKSP
ncbi:MAG: hypothetical protein AAF638_08330 [Pseudomonadota bacterium]